MITEFPPDVSAVHTEVSNYAYTHNLHGRLGQMSVLSQLD